MKSRGELDANRASKSRFERNEHFKAELVPFASNEVGHAGLCDAQTLSRFRFGESVLLNVETKITHHIGSHLEHRGLGRIKAKVHKHIALDLVIFLFMTDLRSGCNALEPIGSPLRL